MFKMFYSDVENFFPIPKVVEQFNFECINAAQESNMRKFFQTGEAHPEDKL